MSVRSPRRHRRARVVAAALSAACFSAGCGVQGNAVKVQAPRSTLFAETPNGSPTSSAQAGTSGAVVTTTRRAIPAVPNDAKARAVVTPTGIVAAVASVRADGAYVVISPCGNEVAVAKVTPIVGANVVLDPGHGGSPDPGTVGPSGRKEAELNLAVALLAKDGLETLGVRVALTRTTDTYATLASRARIATSLAPQAFVSIHHNGAPDRLEDRPGAEVYYQVDDERNSKRLAGLIYEEVTAALAVHKIRWGWYADAGVKVRLGDLGDDYYGILRNAAGVPSALAEFAYLTNPAEDELLATTEFRRLEADALVRAIVRYLTTDDPGSGFVGPSKRTEAARGGGSAGCVEPRLQ